MSLTNYKYNKILCNVLIDKITERLFKSTLAKMHDSYYAIFVEYTVGFSPFATQIVWICTYISSEVEHVSLYN